MKVMQENAVRVQKLMQGKFVVGRSNPDAFKDVAHAFVYGGPQPGTEQFKHSTQVQHKAMEVDPAYEPNTEEMANAESEITAEMEQRKVIHLIIL